MRTFIAGLLLVVSMLFGASEARAQNVTIFPPGNASECQPAGKQYLSWDSTLASTMCRSGQQVMLSAIPTCSASQVVVWDGSAFACKTLKVITSSASVSQSSGFVTLSCSSDGSIMSPSVTCNDTWHQHNSWPGGDNWGADTFVATCNMSADGSSCTANCNNGSEAVNAATASASCLTIKEL